jgi:hypothetical protein
MSRKSLFCFYLVSTLVLTLLWNPEARAQISSSTGAIQGAVTDPQNATIVGATVLLTNTDTNVQVARGTTQSDGGYVFPLLPPGSYKVEIQAQGFESAVLDGIRVDVTKVTVANAKLVLGAVSTQVTVTEAAEAVDTRTAATGDVIENKQIISIPLPTRSFLDLTTLQAGVSATMQSAATVGRGSPTLDVAGARSTSNNLVVDGVDANNFSGNSLSGVIVPSPDAVGEFRVITSMYDASQGRGAGGNINVVLRSGTDKLHGGIFEFYRSNDFNANDFFLNAQGKPTPTLIQNQFGGTLGGPVPKLKDTFWFFSYEGTRQVNGVSGTIAGNQPVLPARASGETEAQYAAALQTAFFPSGMPSGTFIDPVAANLLLLPGQYGGYAFPSGSCAGLTNCGVGTLAGRIALSVPTDYNEDQFVGTVDRNLFRNNHLAAQLFWANISQITPTGGGAGLGQGLTTLSKNEHAALTDTETFTSNLVNELTTGFTYVPSVPSLIENYTVSEIGQQKWDASSVPGISTYSPGGAQGFGGVGDNADQKSANTSITLADTLSWSHGKHTLRFGAEWRRYRWNDDDEFDTRGLFSFTTFDTFLEGAPSSDQIDVGLFARHYRAKDIVWFVQDDFRVTRRLTLNLGLRYDYLGFPDDTQNRIGNFDPTLVPASCIAAGGGNCMQAGFVSPASVPGLGTPGVSDTTLNSQDKHDFAPRIGLAWDVLGNGKLSVRSGYGIYYIRTSGTIVLQLIAAPPWDEEYRGVNPGTDILANPWPAGLPQPSQFPILPQLGQFSGTYSSTGAPIFLDANGTAAAAQNLDGFSRNLLTPYVQQYNLDLQYQLMGGWIMETGYIGSHGVKLTVEPGLNQALLVNASSPITYNNPTIQANGYPNGITVAENSNANATLRATLPGFTTSGLSLLGNYGYSHYNAAILELRHAYAKRLQFKFDYTFSHSDDSNSTDAASALAFNQLVPVFDYGRSSFDQTHRFVFTYVWDIPGPKGRWLSKTIGGWELSGVYTLQSGLPFSLTSNTGGGLAGESAGTSNALVNSCTGSYILSGSVTSNINDYINKSCFSPVANLPSGTIVTGLTPQQGIGSGSFPVGAIPGDTADTGIGSLFGNAQKDMLRGPFEQRFDLALIKNIPLRILGEETNLQFRAEAFKLFNNVNFSNPAANVSLSSFGEITSTIDSTGRILQLGLKLNF